MFFKSKAEIQRLNDRIRELEDRLKPQVSKIVGPDPGKVAVVSCITDNFIGLGATFLASLMENGNLGKGVSVLLLTDPVYAPLSKENRKLLQRICPRVRFLTPDTSFLNEDLVKRWEGGVVVKQHTDQALPSKKSVYLKLCLLRLVEFDTILWLDSDILVARGVKELFYIPASLAMVRGGKPHHHFGLSFGKHSHGFNSGVMLIRKPFISDAVFARSVELLGEKTHTTKQDQSLLNAQWMDEPRLYLPHQYNWKVGLLTTDAEWDDAFENARLIHFDGPCKWKLKDGTRDNKTTAAFHEIREKYAIPMTMEP